MTAQTHDIRQIAQELYPNYDRLEPLGQGGMGDLFRGRKTGLDVPVVIKIIKTNLKGRLDERQEAEILKGLKHKYLPRIYDVIESKNGYFYTIMDYIPGENLKDYVRRTGTVDQKTAFRWGQQLCEVVAYLHEQTPAIIHSDIKPGNVMITPEGDICLIDFNTSMELRAGLTAIGKTKGYAAPEQYTKPEQVVRNMQEAAGLHVSTEQDTILTPDERNTSEETLYVERTGGAQTGTATMSPATSGRSSRVSRFFWSSRLSAADTKAGASGYYGTITKQTDVYAIGATMYFALTGMAPPHALEPAKPISKFRLPISRSMVQIIERAMEKNINDRFRDAAEMGKAFREIHRLDGNFRKARLLTIAGIFLELVLLLGGIAMMLVGSEGMRIERETKYLALLNEVQLAKNGGKYAHALDLAWEAQSLMDLRMEAYAEEAVVYYDQGVNAIMKDERNAYFQQCVDEVEQFAQAERLGGANTEWAKLYFVGAESCLELEKYALAQRWYRNSIDYAASESAYRGLICAYAFAGDMDGAQTVLEEMRVKLRFSDTLAVTELIQAELCYLNKDYLGAIEHYTVLFSLTDDVAILRRTYQNASNACIYSNNLTQSVVFLEQACERLPSAWGIYKPLLANSCFAQSFYVDSEERIVWLEKALEAFSSIETRMLSTSDRLLMNRIRISLLYLEDAEADLLEMKKSRSEDYRVYMWLTQLYYSKYYIAYTLISEDTNPAKSELEYLIECENQAEAAFQTAKNYYEESGVSDSDMDALIRLWEEKETVQ